MMMHGLANDKFNVSSTNGYISNRLHGVISQMIVICIVNTGIISNVEFNSATQHLFFNRDPSMKITFLH